MNTLFEYMIKISACLAAGYFFYALTLRRLTHYKINRFYLLGTALLAFIIPLLPLGFFISARTMHESNFINYIPSLSINTAAREYIPSESLANISVILLSVFIAGVIVCLLHFLMQLISFERIKAAASLISVQFGVKLYHLDKDIMPFSFGNGVFVNKQKHTAVELVDIIKHESVHVHQHHTIDVILAEILCILNWYNPFAWLIKQAIKQNLEFLADDTVLENGADKKMYQYLLLKVTGYSPLHIISSFKFSSLKQRIYMMNKNKTSQKHLLKLLFVLPLIAVIMLAFRDNKETIPGVINNTHEETLMLSELAYNIPDADVNKIVKEAQNKCLLQVGKPFTITLIKNERDRLKSLLENNGYNNIGSHAISFLIDSSLVNNSFAVEVNIDLQRKTSFKNTSKQTGTLIAGNRSVHLQTLHNNSEKNSITAIAEKQVN